jgi:CoA:oxalate CoA-transferase
LTTSEFPGDFGGESRPLAGVVVVDLGQIYNAPYATMLLALAGADVIKVETRTGEPLRKRNAIKETGADLPYWMLNSNKRGVTLDLKDPRGRDLLLEMVARAHVLVENFRPGVMDKLGLGPDVLLARDPSLVYASGSGYGQEGAYRDLPAMDLTIQAMSGIMTSNGFTENPPVKAGPAVADFFGGIHLYGAIVTALYQRAVTGQGARLDVAMLDSVYPSLLSNLGLLLGAESPPPPRAGNRHGGLAVSPYNVYPTRDGYLALITVTEAHWDGILETMGRADLIGDPKYATKNARVAAMEDVDELLAGWTSSLGTAEVFKLLREAGVPCAPVRELREVVDDPHLRERGMIQDHDVPGVGVLPLMHTPLRFVGRERIPLKIAPTLGEHNDEIFGGWLGHTQEELAELREAGVI